MLETQLLHLCMQIEEGTLCQCMASCLHTMQRADLLHLYEAGGTCGNTTCTMHTIRHTTEDEFYEQGPGLCIIINQKLFYCDKSNPQAMQLEDRLGTDMDRNELEATFLLFGADILIFNDLTHT